jgi:hypothetical protein
MLLVMLILQQVTGGGREAVFFILHEEEVANEAGSTTRTLQRVSAGGSAVIGFLSSTNAGFPCPIAGIELPSPGGRPVYLCLSRRCNPWYCGRST